MRSILIMLCAAAAPLALLRGSIVGAAALAAWAVMLIFWH